MTQTPSAEPNVALAVRDLVVRFQDSAGQVVTAVAGVDLTVLRGRTTALVGESGSGKSQLLHAILGLTPGWPGVIRGSAWLQPTQGQLLPLLVPQPNGRPPRFAARYRELQRAVSVVFQGVDSHLHPFHRVRKQLLRKARLLDGHPVAAAGGEDSLVRSRLAPLFLSQREQDRIAGSFPCELSGGQRARVGLCLALTSSAPMLICDEPTTGLDPSLRREIFQILCDRVGQAGKTLLLVSHDVDLVSRLAQDVNIMCLGSILEQSHGDGTASLRDNYSRLLFLPLPEIARRLFKTPVLPPVPTRSRSVSKLLLRAEGLRKEFAVHARINGTDGRVAAVDDVHLDIRRGESVGVVGESGSGKSTLARILAGLLAPDAGTVAFYPESEAGKISPTGRGYQQYVQLLHQNPDTMLHPRVSVGGLCTDSMELWRERCRFRRVRDFLEFAQLEESRSAQLSASLSGGERRRVGLARVLAGRPELVLADEIVSGLDRVLQACLFRNLQALRDEGLTLLVISHDLDLVRHLCERIIVMQAGRIVEECSAGDLYPGRRSHHPHTEDLLSAESLDVSPARRPGFPVEVP